MADRHVVVLSSGEPLPVPQISSSVAKAIRRATADVGRALRFSRGIIDLDLTEIDAEIVAGIFERRGFPARTCPLEDLPVLAPPHALFDADPLEDGLLLQNVDLRQVSELIPWSRLRFSAAGTVKLAAPARPASGGVSNDLDGGDADLGVAMIAALSLLPGVGVHAGSARLSISAGRRPRPRPPREGETVRCLDLVLRDPDDRYRVISGRFVYDYLGKRMALTSRENFRTLILDIARLAPDALLTSTTQSFLTNPKAKSHRFGSPAEFDAYVNWARAWTTVWS